MFFASIVKKNIQVRNAGLKENNFTDPNMLSYKRLVIFSNIFYIILQLDKVTKKIDRWYDEKSKNNKEQFVQDEDFIEHEQSPTHFDSSSSSNDGDDDDESSYNIGDNSSSSKRYKGGAGGKGIRLAGGGTGGGSDISTSSTRKNKGSIRGNTNPSNFKLSLLETNNLMESKLNIKQGITAA